MLKVSENAKWKTSIGGARKHMLRMLLKTYISTHLQNI